MKKKSMKLIVGPVENKFPINLSYFGSVNGGLE